MCISLYGHLSVRTDIYENFKVYLIGSLQPTISKTWDRYQKITHVLDQSWMRYLWFWSKWCWSTSCVSRVHHAKPACRYGPTNSWPIILVPFETENWNGFNTAFSLANYTPRGGRFLVSNEKTVVGSAGHREGKVVSVLCCGHNQVSVPVRWQGNMLCMCPMFFFWFLLFCFEGLLKFNVRFFPLAVFPCGFTLLFVTFCVHLPTFTYPSCYSDIG